MLSLSVGLLALFLQSSSVVAEKGHVGCYYGVWAYARPGLGEFWPEDIDVELCDVIYYGFGNVLNDTYEVCSWDPWFDLDMSDGNDLTIKNCVQEKNGVAWPPGCVTEDGLDYCKYDGMRRTIALKQKNPDLKVLWSVGGWTAGGWIFSQMASTSENRHKFIVSLLHFLKHFGFDGVDLDWEYPAWDGVNGQPTNPQDREHFTLLIREMHQVLSVEGYLITFAGAADPAKVAAAFELEKIAPFIDWINIMSYDYHGAFDNFTGIDQPLYGRWGEGFVGHPGYQFNMHATVQYYLNHGIPPTKLVLGIHTESKAWLLHNTNLTTLYCPAYEAAPNMTYSRQEGWLFYYEVLQFWHNETIEDPLWSDLKPGKESWTIYDKEHGNWDGCYLSPFMYQGRYWISYDDEDSVDVKSRYANHYGLKGAFVWEVDTDNFRGLYGKEPYNILRAIRRAIDSGATLQADEILGNANDNIACQPQVDFCDFSWPEPVCTTNSDCNEDDSVICDSGYTNCFYCDQAECKPGCSDNQNCPDSRPLCNADNRCQEGLGYPGITRVTVHTEQCQGCGYSHVEEGLVLELVGRYGAECKTENLDNPHHHDYYDNHRAVFNSQVTSAGQDMGLGACNSYDLGVALTNGTAEWTGEGQWTPTTERPICINFYDPNYDKPTCCCSLSRSSLSSSDGPVSLTGCSCFMP